MSNKVELCQISPRLKLLMQQEGVSVADLAKSIGMYQTTLNKALNNNNFVWPWTTLSKILWVLGYKIEGLRLSKIESKT